MHMRELLPTQKAALTSFLQQKGEDFFSDDKISTYYIEEMDVPSVIGCLTKNISSNFGSYTAKQ